MKLKLPYLLYVCEAMTLEDLISSHVDIYVCVVSLITKLFHKFKPISRFKPLRKRRLSYFQRGGHKCATRNR